MKKTSINHKRKEAMILRSLSKIITEEVKNSDISYPTVTSIKLSNDASHVLVYVMFESYPQKSLAALKKTKGFIKSRLAKLGMRIVPDVSFKIDDVLEKANKIEKILNDLKKYYVFLGILKIDSIITVDIYFLIKLVG